MPTYDYRCEANGKVVEVNHRMSESITTWGQLCAQSNIEPGDTPSDAQVKKLANGGQVVRSSSLGESKMPPCSNNACSMKRQCEYG